MIDPLPHLRPYAEKHAIFRFELSLFLERGLELERLKDLRNALVQEHNGHWRFDPFDIRVVNFQGEFSLDAGVPNIQTSARHSGPEGFGLKATQIHRQQTWDIRLSNVHLPPQTNAQHANDKQALAVVLSTGTYDRWQSTYQSVAPLIHTLIAQCQRYALAPVIALGVAYFDWFYWDSTEPPTVNRLLNASSEWIPQRLSNANGECQFHFSTRNRPYDDEKDRVDFLNFSVALYQQRYLIAIYHHLIWELHAPQTAPDTDSLFFQAHNENKKMFSNVLHADVLGKLPEFQPLK